MSTDMNANVSTEEEHERVDDSVASDWSTKARLGNALALIVRLTEANQAVSQLLDTAQSNNNFYLTERKEAITANIDMERRLHKAEQDLDLAKTEVIQLRKCVLLTPVGGTRVVLSKVGQNKITTTLRDSGRFQLSLPTGGWGHHTNHHNHDPGEMDRLLNNELAGVVFDANDFSQGTRLE